MYVIVVYDTAAKRNPKVLKLCRKYLHHIQRSVFEGRLSEAQLVKFRHEMASLIDHGYDHVTIYTFPPGTAPQRVLLGTGPGEPETIL
ncbi:CRISPR-associated endonuclease Cas2 [Carbonactinospora thermoautotrophica]|uniref:CRISPR-associated endoribonuclease Cas2 n=1 Tax=Carbonactinospora thermoautotrophica TaxID=1469144 RepID=A0A132MZZ6_9ACTN|nr:CRISPR-associated endonuclease Cas2 [Carbonactinospora thermoautotrophica]KWX03250.1 CRISPR-associated endoribonuclease Cas2 [Carbonactinospora thermoautotrophica]KWX05884.1 CRISPR-associated protein Cas2 [Carbonactinospora thermoautotrophica]KWX07392.1 CRISPR-associated protein Cas2 [Carbonactinospora thermoautotrophica]MCX9193103.1 CRISPR-associated endonuclease Cas2 [Carbonactinospora thermoautotrophica]